jgi:hypothetical protein
LQLDAFQRDDGRGFRTRLQRGASVYPNSARPNRRPIRHGAAADVAAGGAYELALNVIDRLPQIDCVDGQRAFVPASKAVPAP